MPLLIGMRSWRYRKNAEIELLGLFKNSLQGDAAGAKLFAQLGVGTTYTKRGVMLKHTGNICEKLVYNFVNEPDLAQTFVVTCVLLNIPSALRDFNH